MTGRLHSRRCSPPFANDFPIGAAVGRPQLLGERGQLLAKHFNSVTAGNAMKWDTIQPVEGTFNYTDADAIVAFARANAMKVRGHTFVWYNQTPAWVFNDANGQPMTATAANKTLLLARLEAHIRALGALSYIAPILSTAILVLCGLAPATTALLIAALLVTMGAILASAVGARR